MIDPSPILEQLLRYWPWLTGAAAAVASALALIIKWQTVRKNAEELRKQTDERKERDIEKRRDDAGIQFENIGVGKGNVNWQERGQYFFTLTSAISGADPSFDVTLVNDGKRDQALYAIGVRIVLVATYSYSMRGVAGN